ncbi:UrcA family protein [Oceanicaulis sp. MMSF_3324]|uniref:UrcA family protein n=1 Tax=Oceanicaulis sp. MMSF_3324 TaxID=3046702 RepID=UPI00273E5210|nr:UrcA family protein [Oceanicaulis sp. MMSF_3324]
MTALKTLFAAAVVACVCSTASHAQTFNFEYDRWMLSSPEGRSAVLDRLANRVESYCKVHEARGLWEVRIARDCQVRTTGQVLERMNDPRVYALHQERVRLQQVTERT